MTGTPSPLLLVTALAVLSGCPEPAPGPVEAPPVELPPPLSELREEETPAEVVVDPADWRLPDPDTEPDHRPWLRLFYSQDNRGELEACGCPGAPTGGMARRATLVPQVRAVLPDALIVEGPSALSRAVLGFENVTGEHRRRARLVLELIAGTSPAAFFPGQADFAVIAPPELADLAERHGLPLVATNLAVAEPAFQRYLVHEVGDRRVLLLGLVRPAGTEERIQEAPTTDAVVAAAEALAAAEAEAGRIDLVVAFTDGDVRSLGRWRSAGLDVDVLLVPAESTDQRGSWYHDNGQLIVRSEPLGRALRRLDVVLAPDPHRGLAARTGAPWQLERVASYEALYFVQTRQIRALEDRAAAGDDPREAVVGFDGVERIDPKTDPEAMRASLAEAKAQRRQALAASHDLPARGASTAVSNLVLEPDVFQDEAVQRRLDAASARRLEELQLALPDREQVPAGQLYAGKDACTECHSEVMAHWGRTQHAGSWRSLVERGETANPECLTCHTTGFGVDGGFADPATDRALLQVQCEACHGPMAVHAEQAGQIGFKPDPGLPVGESTCRGCHDEANSPRFDFEVYYPKVAHPGLRP